jgi:hypothetical protein
MVLRADYSTNIFIFIYFYNLYMYIYICMCIYIYNFESYTVRLKDSFESRVIIELLVVINATKVSHL